MIDAASLRQLGWSEELIEEITRTANHLRATAPGLEGSLDQVGGSRAYVDSSVFFDSASVLNQSAIGLILVQK